MKDHYSLSDEEFERDFSNASMPPALFTHEAHLRLAWLYIDKYGLSSAEEKIHNQLVAYVTKLGATEKYHKTVTIAAVKTVYHFMLKSSADSFPDFVEEFPRLKLNFKELLASHYSYDLFGSDEARREYLEPDLADYDTVD